MAAAPLSLTARALRLLAQREHSRLGLQRKVQRYEELLKIPVGGGEVREVNDA